MVPVCLVVLRFVCVWRISEVFSASGVVNLSQCQWFCYIVLWI